MNGCTSLHTLTRRCCPYASLPSCPPRNLRRLDISDLPAVSNPGLTQILVEEMLPNCEILGADWAQGLKLGLEEQPQDTAGPRPA